MYDPMKLVVWALDHVGLKERTGRNDHPLIQKFMRGDRLAWCAGFLLWGLKETGGPLPPGNGRFGRWSWYYTNRAVTNWEKNLKKVGVWKGPKCVPSPGDLVFWKNRYGSDKGRGAHIDLVVEVDVNTRKLKLVGGNVSNQVLVRYVSMDNPRISGYGELVSWDK